MFKNILKSFLFKNIIIYNFVSKQKIINNYSWICDGDGDVHIEVAAIAMDGGDGGSGNWWQ